MLRHLHIRNFALVDTLELDFQPGMTVLTGETGAGKSILLDALSLALGDRADSGVVRAGAERADITVTFSIEGAPGVREWLREQEMEADDECILRRTIGADSRSKGFINGNPVPVQLLKEIGERLVEIHGQHAHQSLLKREVQRQLLDAFSALRDPLADLASHFRQWKKLREERERLAKESEGRAARIDLLRYQISELKGLKLGEGELAELDAELRLLSNASRLVESAQRAETILDEAEEAAVITQLGRIQAELSELLPLDPRLEAACQLLDNALIQCQEASSELRDYLGRIDVDPRRLEWVEQRLGEIHSLARKNRIPPEALPELLTRMQGELQTIELEESRRDGLDGEIVAAEKRYFTLAEQVSAARAAAASNLSRQVTEYMQELGMAGGRFEVTLDAAEPSAAGLERVEFLVCANPGQPQRPLAKVASGGELSRISLAIQVATAGIEGIPTLIFDEVDVGIGGGVAERVGRQLRRLGEQRQVLCVTHQPQVAALGHHHLQVQKEVVDGNTVTRVQPLSAEGRIDEVARMVGGIEITAQTRSHAEEMVKRGSAMAYLGAASAAIPGQDATDPTKRG